MKQKFFKRALLFGAGLVILSIAVLTAVAETEVTDGCPPATGGYLFEGNRDDEECKITIIENGYWWYFKGEVKWVGTIFADMKGEFKAAKKETIITGIQYRCDGLNFNKCWVCNCYHQLSDAPIEH